MTFQAVGSFPQVVNFAFQLSESALRCFVLFALESLPLDLQLEYFPLYFVDLYGHAVDLDS
jgi:hypothetical protein